MSQKSCCVPECPITAEDAEIYKQKDTITDNNETNINVTMNRKNADCSNSSHSYFTDQYNEITIDKTYDDQKVYIEIATEMDLSHFEDCKNCIKLEKENSDGVELVQQVSEDYGTHDSSVGNKVKIKNVDPKVYIKRSKKSEEVTNESVKITNEDLQIKVEIDVNDENKEKIVENEAGVTVDLSIVKQEVDNELHMQIKEEQNKVVDLEIKKEVEDCNEVLNGIFEVSKLESDFEADDDTNIGAIIAEIETRVEPKPKDDIQCDVDSNVLNRNLRKIASVNTFSMKKRKKCHRKASGDTYNCTKCLCIFESFDRYVSHFFLHDIKPNACPLCETYYESVKPLCDHIRNFHIAKSFVFLRLFNHEFDKMETYKCLVCEDIVIKQHCFNHWEKHFRFEASKQRLGLKSLDFDDVDRKLENTFSAKVMKKSKAAIYKQKDTITDNDETNINVTMNRKNADCSNITHNYLNKIVENEPVVRVDLSIVKQEVDNGFHVQIKEEQNKVDDLEIKKEVEDYNKVLNGICEVSKSESDFEADDDTNIAAIIAETKTRVKPKPKDDIQCDVDSNVLNINLRTIARVNTFRREKRRKCHRFRSMMEKNTDYSHEQRKRKRQINDSSDDGKVEEERNRKNREKCKRYREKKKNEVVALSISGSSDFDEKKREERRQKNREKIRRYREKKKNEVAAVSTSGSFDSDERKREERKQKNRENVKRYREKKKKEIAAVSNRGPLDSDEKKREEERKQKNREKVRRYREKKKNEVAAVSIRGPFDSDEKKREEERKQKNREKVRRYREKKRNEVGAVPISGPFDFEGKKREEERKRKNREKVRRYREKKKNEIAALLISGSSDFDQKKREEERKQRNKESVRRYREKKKNKVPAMSISRPFDSDEEKRQEERKQKNRENCKRYRNKKRTSNLQTQNISNSKNVSQQIHISQIASPSTRDVPNVPLAINTSQIAGPSTKYVPYVPPVLHSSTIAGSSSRDVPYIPPSHSNNNSPIHSIEDRVLQSHTPSQIDPPPPNINLQTYSAYQKNSSARREFEKDFVENEFGPASSS